MERMKSNLEIKQQWWRWWRNKREPSSPGNPLLLPKGHPWLEVRDAGVGAGLAVRLHGAHPLLGLLLWVLLPVRKQLAVHVLQGVDALTLGLVLLQGLHIFFSFLGALIFRSIHDEIQALNEYLVSLVIVFLPNQSIQFLLFLYQISCIFKFLYFFKLKRVKGEKGGRRKAEGISFNFIFYIPFKFIQFILSAL